MTMMARPPKDSLLVVLMAGRAGGSFQLPARQPTDDDADDDDDN